MLSKSFVAFVFLAASAFAAPVVTLPKYVIREVPQEHSHEATLTAVRTSLNLNNPDGIVDPVFGLLGDAAAAAGLGKITDPDCLQQATADQAFTNAKAAGDVEGQTQALIYRALERNTGKVGLASVACTSIQAVNPEIAAIQQHQDPASNNAAAVNKAIVLELAKQIASIGGNPQDALLSGTFAPGNLDDNTGKGNTCDDANDPNGCIFTQNLIVDDATADEINAAVAGISSGSSDASSSAGAADDSTCPTPATVTVTAGAEETAAASAADTASDAVATSGSASSSASGNNVQTFTGALGGISAPPVIQGGAKGFVTDNSDFINASAALGRSCDVQHNQCANLANSAAGRAQGLTVGQCDTQDTQCRAATGS